MASCKIIPVKAYHTVETGPINRKLVEKEVKSIPITYTYTQIYYFKDIKYLHCCTLY